jgi:hypothetical protein
MKVHLEGPIFFPITNFVIAVILVHFYVFWFEIVHRLRCPTIGISTYITSRTGCRVFDQAGGIVARVPFFTEVVDACFFADGRGRSESRCAGRDWLCSGCDGNWRADIATFEGRDCWNRKDGGSRTSANFSVLNDVNGFDFDNRFVISGTSCRGEGGKSGQNDTELQHDDEREG